jgi:hypothetical protein
MDEVSEFDGVPYDLVVDAEEVALERLRFQRRMSAEERALLFADFNDSVSPKGAREA